VIKLELCKEEDYHFVYQLVEDFFKTDLNVMYMKLDSFDEFIKKAFVKSDKHYIVKNEKGKRIGHVHIMDNNEIGYFMVSEYQSKGIGTEAVKKLIELNPRERYFATIHNKNKPSIRLIEKLGFLQKGTIYEKKEEFI